MNTINPFIQEAVENLTAIITFKIITSIYNFYGSLENYLQEYHFIKSHQTEEANLKQFRMLSILHVDTTIVNSICRSVDKRSHATKCFKLLNQSKLCHKGKTSKKYKSGKVFSMPSYFYIPFDYLSHLFQQKGTQLDPFNSNSDFYTKEQHQLIDQLIFHYEPKVRRYRKSQKFYDYQESRQLSTSQQLSNEVLLNISYDECKAVSKVIERIPQHDPSLEDQRLVLECSLQTKQAS